MHSTSLNLLLKTMFDMPDDARCRKFADYVVDNFVAADSDFPPTLWTHAPDVMPVTTNGAESYHGRLNAEFNVPHPNIYIFLEVLLRQQAATYVTVTSLSKSRTIPRSIREKSARLHKLFTYYSAGLQTRLDKIIFNVSAINSHRYRSLPCIWWDSRCYCLLFLACRVFALSCQYICAIVVILFALSLLINVQQFTRFLRFRYSSITFTDCS